MKYFKKFLNYWTACVYTARLGDYRTEGSILKLDGPKLTTNMYIVNFAKQGQDTTFSANPNRILFNLLW